MRHLSEGEIRAYQDEALGASAQAQAQAHLEGCPRCQRQAEALLARAQRVEEHLAALHIKPNQTPLTLGAARSRLASRRGLPIKEYETMMNKLTSRTMRPVWTVLAVVALLVAALGIPQVRAAANTFLSLFRVKQIAVVPVNPGDLANQLGDSAKLEEIIADSLIFDDIDPVEVASAAEASGRLGTPVRLPQALGEPTKLAVSEDSTAVMNVDLPRIQALLDEAGRSDIRLPAALDGAQIKVNVSAGAFAQFGDCDFDPQEAREHGYNPDDPDSMPMLNCTTLVQMPSPTVEAPESLDVQQVGEAFLQVMGMSAEEAASFSANVDWTTTFVVPIPRNGTDYQEVQVDGVTGTLIMQERGNRPERYMLLWVKDGFIYSLAGPGTGEQAVEIANSLQ